MGFSRPGYWSGLCFPPTGDLPYPGIELASLALSGRFPTTEPAGKPILSLGPSEAANFALCPWNLPLRGWLSMPMGGLSDCTPALYL